MNQEILRAEIQPLVQQLQVSNFIEMSKYLKSLSSDAQSNTWQLANEFSKIAVKALSEIVELDIGFKSSQIPGSIDTGLLDCQRDGCYFAATDAATTNQTNSIWYLCAEDAKAMENGEVWW